MGFVFLIKTICQQLGSIRVSSLLPITYTDTAVSVRPSLVLKVCALEFQSQLTNDDVLQPSSQPSQPPWEERDTQRWCDEF